MRSLTGVPLRLTSCRALILLRGLRSEIITSPERSIFFELMIFVRPL